MIINHTIFLDKLNDYVNRLGIDISNATLDHIAYYTTSSENYDQTKLEFEKFSKLVKEPLVNERRVGVFKFHKPIEYNHQNIKAIELIEPRKNQVIKVAGLEHAEYILPVDLEEFVNNYPDINWDTSRINREQFPMLKLRLSDSMQIKFPRYPILSE
jgi:predicted metalloenzyme YecM